MENRNRRHRNRHRDPPLLLRYFCKFLGWFIFFVSLGFKFYKSPIHHKILELSKYGHDPKIAVEKEDDVYHQSPEVFKSDYANMEHNLKIYAYPTYSDDVDDQEMKHANKSEHGCAFYFFKNLLESSFMTDDPDEAHLFFVPLSNHIMLQQASSANESSFLGEDYVRHIISAYPHWNATFGSDHFFITCDETDVRAIENIPLLVKNASRLVCSPTYQKSDAGNNDISIPSDIEPYKLKMEIDITNSRVIESLGHQYPQLAENKLYIGDIVQRDGRYCVCLSSRSIPTSNCIVGAINYNCVPVVLLSDYYDLPLSDVLDWRKFSAIVRRYQLPYLRRTVLNNPKSDKQYKDLYRNLLKVKHHFKWNSRAERYDAFHMALYNLWMRRKDEIF